MNAALGPGFAPGAPTTAHSYAYESLRNRILTGGLVPGTPLIQANLAAELSISMTPVREALRDLATEGLVTQSPHRGAVVTALNVTDAIEINEIRLKLEPDAIADAANVITPAALGRAEELYTMLSTASAGEWIALNREFHMYLIAQTPSSRVRGILTNLAGFAALYVGVAISHRHGAGPQQEHREILDTIARNDAPAVRLAVARHLQHSLTSLREAAHDPAVIARVD